jgi:hypothetical protein
MQQSPLGGSGRGQLSVPTRSGRLIVSFTHDIAHSRPRNGSNSSNRVGEAGAPAFFTHAVAVMPARPVRHRPVA